MTGLVSIFFSASRRVLNAFLAAAILATPVAALDAVKVNVKGNDNDLKEAVKSASLLSSAIKEQITAPDEILAAANADYGRILGALYSNGYYSGTISILVDGVEAGQIRPLATPKSIARVSVVVDPGRAFKFGTARVSPLAKGTVLPAEFRSGGRAKSALIQTATQEAVLGWRKAGHAKAAPSGQSIIADHFRGILSADVRIAPGPPVIFGDLLVGSKTKVSNKAVQRIAGLSTGETYSPDHIELVAKRLRRTGAFRSVTLDETDELSAQNSMDVVVTLVDEKPRRFGFGAELSSMEGLTLSGFWLHRNFLGGAERFRAFGEIANIAGQTGGIDYSLGFRLERPAVTGPDTKAFIFGEASVLDEPDYLAHKAVLGIGAVRIVSDRLEFELGTALEYSEVEDDFGIRKFTMLTFPGAATLDNRDNNLNPKGGYYAALKANPFVGFGGTQSGARLALDTRAYRNVGQARDLVLAARLQFGSVLGSEIAETPPDYLFYSGGGGTVRGHPYQSLDVQLPNGDNSGGRSYVGFSSEVRAEVSKKISAVGFFDTGYIGSESVYSGEGKWHSGAGIGLRYDTPVGPIRFDIAAPIMGDTGSGVQFYVGIGQAF